MSEVFAWAVAWLLLGGTMAPVAHSFLGTEERSRSLHVAMIGGTVALGLVGFVTFVVGTMIFAGVQFVKAMSEWVPDVIAGLFAQSIV